MIHISAMTDSTLFFQDLHDNDWANKMHTQLHVFFDDMFIHRDSCICNITLNAIVATHLIAFNV
jgi:hypothetical protein